MPLLAPAFAYNFDLSIYGDFFVGGGCGGEGCEMKLWVELGYSI